MKRSCFFRVLAFLAATGIAASAWAGHGGSFGGSAFHAPGNFGAVKQATFHAPINPIHPIGVNPTFPINPVGGHPIGPGKFPVGPIGPIKPPGGGGVVVDPVHPIVPIGPIGPIKPPGGGIVVDPVHPIGPIGPIKPPGNGNGGVVGPIGPIKPPGGAGGQPPLPPGPGTGGNCKPCKPWWPPIVLGCIPYGGYGGYYGGSYPVYTSTMVVPAATTTVVATQPVTTTTVASAEELPQVPVGSTLTLNAKDLGATKGQTLLVIDKLTLGVQVDEWSGDHATVTLPMLAISGPTKAEIVLVKSDGYAASKVKVELVPAPEPSGGTAVAATVR